MTVPGSKITSERRQPGVAAVLGAGPGLGMSIARRFGRAGHPVAVVSRSDARHQSYLDQLELDGVPAVAEIADLKDHDQLLGVLNRIRERLGPIEVLYFGPAGMGPADFPVPIEQITGKHVRHAFGLVDASVEAVRAVLPGMLERGRGAILLPTGASAITPMPQLGQLALAGAALRSYALTLNAALRDRGVFAGSIVIGGGIKGGDIHTLLANREAENELAGLDRDRLAALSLDPDEIAEATWRMVDTRDRAELVFSVLD